MVGLLFPCGIEISVMSINIRAEIMTVRIVDNTGAQGVTELTLKAMVEVGARGSRVRVG